VPRRTFIVTIAYREPTFELHIGRGPTLYSGTFVVVSENEDDAVALALSEFRRVEALSWVGWSRAVESLSVAQDGIEP
jgi:hypothetical protein